MRHLGVLTSNNATHRHAEGRQFERTEKLGTEAVGEEVDTLLGVVEGFQHYTDGRIRLVGLGSVWCCLKTMGARRKYGELTTMAQHIMKDEGQPVGGELV